MFTIKFRTALTLNVSLKIILAALTPLGYDFVQTMILTLPSYPDLSWSPWLSLVRLIYAFWLALPIEHGDLYLALYNGNVLLPSHYLISLLVKTPIIISDIGTALLIRRFYPALTGSKSGGDKAAILWLSNPYVTLFGEMWGSLDIILVCLTLLGVMLLVARRFYSAFLMLAVGIAVRLSPVIAWLGMVAWTIRNFKKPYEIMIIFLAAPLGLLGYLLWLSHGQLGRFLDLWPILSTYSPVTQTFTQYTNQNIFSQSEIAGFAVAASIGATLLALETWNMTNFDSVPLISATFLLVYAFGIWSPTAFLWAMPYLALWHARYPSKMNYYRLFLLSIAASLFTFSRNDLTSNGLSLLFIPWHILPYGGELVAAFRFSFMLNPAFVVIRSFLAGYFLSYALLFFWNGLVSSRSS